MKFLTAIATVGLLTAATPVLADSIADEQAKANLHQAKADAQVQADVSSSDAAAAQRPRVPAAVTAVERALGTAEPTVAHRPVVAACW